VWLQQHTVPIPVDGGILTPRFAGGISRSLDGLGIAGDRVTVIAHVPKPTTAARAEGEKRQGCLRFGTMI
jgi:hypothetical protein